MDYAAGAAARPGPFTCAGPAGALRRVLSACAGSRARGVRRARSSTCAWGPGCGFAREARGKESVCVRAWRPAVRHCDAQGAALLSVLVAARGDAI